MTTNLSRRSLLALGAGLGASTMLGGSALARAPKLGTQPSYFYRFGLGDAEVTVVSDGPLPLGPPKGTFVGVPDDEVKKMLSDNFLSPENVVLEQNSPIVNMGDKLVLFDMFSVTFREPWVIQRFLPEIKHGDKRIILVDDEFAGAVNRVPAPDDLRSNMVRGGAAQATELSPREREICERLAPALRARGLLFVGIDVIDGNLTEINVTSPTGIRAIARLGGPDVAARIWDAIEAKRAKR